MKKIFLRKHIISSILGISCLCVIMLSIVSHFVYPHVIQTEEDYYTKHKFLHHKPMKLLTDSKCEQINTYLAVAYMSSFQNFDQREKVRKAWMDMFKKDSFQDSSYQNYYHKGKSVGIKRVFILGTQEKLDGLSQARLNKEIRKYGDIVQGAFRDTYLNFTLKTLTLLHWKNTSCGRAEYLLKMDDNVHLNLPTLLEEIAIVQTSQYENGFVLGYQKQSERMRAIQRVKYHKNSISYNAYQGSLYPVHAAGPAYVVSFKAVHKLLKSCQSLPYLPIEDVFVTGVCREKAGVASLNGRFCTDVRVPSPDTCAIEHLDDEKWSFNRLLSNVLKLLLKFYVV